MRTLPYFLFIGISLFLLKADVVACSLNPTAIMSSPVIEQVYYIDTPVLLDASSSVANYGTITEYRWRTRIHSFQSWTTISTSAQAYHEFTSAAVHSVELRVRNSAGKYHTITRSVNVTLKPKRFYYLTDHLGSVRVTVDEEGDPVSWDDYYPFGLQMPTRNQNSANPNDDTKFTGYELEQQGDLDIYHAEARMYDPVIGRFMSVDPMAHLYPGHTPYHYVLNNPLNFTDPTGMYVVSRAYRTGSGVVSTVTRQNHSFVRTIEGTNSVVGYIPIAGSIVTAQKVMYQRIAGDPSWQPSGWDYASIATLGLSRVTERFVKGARGVSRGISTGGAVSGAMDGFITSDMGRDEVLFDVAAGFGGGNLFRKDGEIGLTLNEGYANALAASVGLDGVDAFTNAFMAVAAGFITGIANQQGFDLTRSEGRQAAYQYYLDNREEYDQMLMDVLGRTNRQR